MGQPRQVRIIHVHGAPSTEGATFPPHRSHPDSLQTHAPKQQTPQVPQRVRIILTPFPPWVVTLILAAPLMQQVLGGSAVTPWFDITAPGPAQGVLGFMF